MKKIILYIASSLDGYIADADNRLDWLTVYKGNYGYEDFISSVDTVICGRATYDWVVEMGMPDPYLGKVLYVLTHSPEKYTSTDSIVFTSRPPEHLAAEIVRKPGKDVFLVGGGGVIAHSLEHNLIDEIILFIVPVVLGNGIPLFQKISRSVQFTTVSSKTYDDGMIELRLKKQLPSEKIT